MDKGQNGGTRPGCELAPNRAPAPKHYKVLISLTEFVLGGVPISGVKSVQ